MTDVTKLGVPLDLTKEDQHVLFSLDFDLGTHAKSIQLVLSDFLIERLVLKHHREYRSNIIQLVDSELSS